MIVLAWLRKEPMDLKTFVQNRVAKIQELYSNQLWRHVPSDQNPADLVSRGVDPDKLLQQNLWFNGPTFLSAKPIVSTQIMGNLPKERLITDYPFNCSGVDFFGPFFIKNKGQRKGNLFKVYICIFVSFVFKTVHIELVSDLTSQAFIAALKRFMARRGKCAKLFSDNGKNFVGASNEIKKLLEIVRKSDQKLANYLAAEGIEWKFIPARSPNFGGLWEAAIKSCKYHLKRVVNGINLTHEELLTVTVQIEGILNSRPLCPLSNNDDDFQVLRPAHFLINRSLNSLEEPNLTKCKERRRIAGIKNGTGKKKSASNPRKNIALNTEKNAVFTAERYSVFAEEAIQFTVNGRNILMERKRKKWGKRESPKLHDERRQSLLPE
ncbi:integrase catalytic domain-containing protein [Trichonephila clavipes]|nr:integrase catalytic domain-containing protein [Trichonephila clavipes]